MRPRLKGFVSDQSGATAIEYGLIASLIALVVIASMTNLSNVMWTKMNNVANVLK